MNSSRHLRAVSMVLLCALLLQAMAGCAPQATPTPEVKVLKFGAAISLSGLRVQEGKVQQDGINFWVDWVNSHGGLDIGGEKYMVEVIYLDDESDPQTAAKLTEKLITEYGTKFLIGPYSSAITIATAAIGEKYQAITIAPQANSPTIYNQGYRYVFAILPPATTYLRLLIEMAAGMDPKPQTVAILELDDPFGTAVATGVQQYAEAAGLTVVLREKFAAGPKDLSSLLTKAKALNPDIVLGTGIFQEAVLITRQAKELGLCPKIMGFSAGPAYPQFSEQMGADAEYVYGSEWWLPEMGWIDDEYGDSENYAQMFEAKYGYRPDYHAASGTAAGKLYQIVLEKAGTLDLEKVRDTLANIDLEFFWGPHAFDEKGQNRKGGSGVIQVQEGKPIPVYPASVSKAAPRFPMPCWDER